jgi:hypothetical protein
MSIRNVFAIGAISVALVTVCGRAEDQAAFEKRLAAEVQKVKKETSNDSAHKYLDMLIQDPKGAFLAYQWMTSPPDAQIRCVGELAALYGSQSLVGQEKAIAAARAMSQGRGLRLFVLDAAADKASPYGSAEFRSLYQDEAARLTRTEPSAEAQKTKQLAERLRTAYSEELAKSACNEAVDLDRYYRQLAAQPK